MSKQCFFLFSGRLKPWPLLTLGAGGIAALIIGCGGSGGGGGGTQPALMGDNAAEAVAISAAKAIPAGEVPFFLLQKMSGPQPFIARLTRGLTLIPALNLYESDVVNGKNLSIKLFTDSAGTKPAGTIAVNSSEPLTGSFTYPVTFNATATQVVIPVQGGNPLTLNGQFSVRLEDSAGKNELSGSLTLSPDAVSINLDVAAGNGGTILGTVPFPSAHPATIGISYSGTTATLSQLTGTAAGTISGNADVTYTGFSGTGTGSIDLTTGAVSLNVTDAKVGNFVVQLPSPLTLNVTLPSGLTKVISDPGSFVLSSIPRGGGPSGGSTGGGGASLALMNGITDNPPNYPQISATFGTKSLGALGDGAVSFEYPVTAGSGQTLTVTNRSTNKAYDVFDVATAMPQPVTLTKNTRYVAAVVGNSFVQYWLLMQSYPGGINAMPDSTHSWITIFNGQFGTSTDGPSADFYVLPKGTSLAGQTPTWANSKSLTSSYANLINITSGTWTITVTAPGSPHSLMAVADVTLTPGKSTVAELVADPNGNLHIWSENDPGPAK